MLNHVVLVGRVLSYIELEENVIKIQIIVPRKKEGCDVVPIFIKGNLSNTFRDYYSEKALIGVRGMIRSDDVEELYVLAERITLLSKENTEVND